MDLNTAAGIAAGIVTVGTGIYSGIRHYTLSRAIKKDRERKLILDQAKAELDKVEAELSNKIKDLEIELALAKEKVSQDFIHLKEVYNAEISNLGDKIESLRSDLQAQHSQMIELLTRLVGKS